MPFSVDTDGGGLMVAMVGREDWPARDDVDLVAQIAAGDFEDPVAELYRRYAGRLYRFGIQLLGDSGLAEELVQECFRAAMADGRPF